MFMCDKHDHHAEKMEKLFKQLKKEVGLDENQIKKLEALKDKKEELHKKKCECSHEDHMSKLRDFITAETFDQDKALNVFNQHAEKRKQGFAEVLPLLAAFIDSLNKEQKEKLVEIIEAHHKHHHKKGHHHGHHHCHENRDRD